MRTRVLILATALLASAGLQAQDVPKTVTATTPATVDRAAVLREIGVAHGMLRGVQYNDATTTAQYQATGTQYIVGQAFKPGGPWPAAKLTRYNVWVNYAVPGMRIDLERTNPDGRCRAEAVFRSPRPNVRSSSWAAAARGTKRCCREVRRHRHSARRKIAPCRSGCCRRAS